MKRLSLTILATSSILLTGLVFAAEKITPCEEVLQFSSQDWIDNYTKANGEGTLEQVKAILRYEHCYDQQLQARKEKLDEANRGPLMGMMGNFRDLESSIKEFTNLAIRACGQNAERVRIQRAYAYLYQLQFKNFFYLQYEDRKKIPKTDMAQVKQLQNALEEQFKKEHQQDGQLLRNRFSKFRQLAEDMEMPMQNVYGYALMVMKKSGSLISTQNLPF